MSALRYIAPLLAVVLISACREFPTEYERYGAGTSYACSADSTASSKAPAPAAKDEECQPIPVVSWQQ